MGITKPCTHLHPAHFNLHPAPSTSTQLSVTPSAIFEPKYCTLQYWAISPNFGLKIKSCPFWLKIGTHGILEVLIPNPDLGFWNSDPKIHFWVNFGSKIQSCRLKIGTRGISRMLIPNPDLDFWNFDPKIHFWSLKVVHFVWKLVHMLSQWCWFLFQHYFSEFQILISFLGKFGPKKSKLSLLTENWYTWYLGSADS